MSPFHSGMNHWQRQDLSDRIHKRGRYAPNTPAGHPPSIPLSDAPADAAKSAKPKRAVKKKTKSPTRPSEK